MPDDLNGVRLKLVETLDDAMELKRWMGERRPVLGLDTETTGLDWWRDTIRLVQVGDALTGWAIPYPDWKGLAREILEPYEGPIALHNAKFDLHFLERDGIHTPRRHVHDTRPLAHVLDSASPTGLKSLAMRHIHPKVNAGEKLLKGAMKSTGWTWQTVPYSFGPYWQYGALDPVMTARLYENLTPRVRATGCWDLYELEVACELVLMDAETRGVRLNFEYLDEREPQLQAKLAETDAWIRAEFGIENPGSDQQVISYLYGQGVTWDKRTEKGNIALDEEVLAGLTHPLAQALLAHRETQKLLKTYLGNFRKFADGDYLHASINPLGARTGRMSVSRPSLQNIPRSPDPRDAFIAREGRKLVLIDYDQVELRLLAHFAGEPAMIEAIHNGIDLHTRTAQLVFGLGDEEPAKRQRQIAKNANFAKIYGSGTKTFAKTAGVTIQEAQAFNDRYDATYTHVRMFMRQVEQVALKRAREEGEAYVRTPAGRLHRTSTNTVYRLVNYLIQGTAADILKRKIVDLDLMGLADNLILPVHDELIFDVPEGEVDAFVEECVPAMEERREFAVPLSAGVSVVDRWGDGYR